MKEEKKRWGMERMSREGGVCVCGRGSVKNDSEERVHTHTH